MPRHLVVIPGHPHHVILRGNNRRTIFSRRGCYLRFASYLADASRRHGVPVHGAVFMRNHVHLVMTPPDANALAMCVKRFAQRYALARNRLRGGSGKLFEQRYVAIPIATTAQLAATLSYVELNPVRAGLVLQADEWPWSTSRLHTARADFEPAMEALWTPSDWYLGLDRTPDERARLYASFVADRAARTEVARSRPYDDRSVERPDRSSAAERAAIVYGANSTDGSDS